MLSLLTFQFDNSTGIALDLGADFGFQSLPLAKLGFSIKAVDFSRLLLKELMSHKNNLDIEIFTCFLEYQDEFVKVFNIVPEKEKEV